MEKVLNLWRKSWSSNKWLLSLLLTNAFLSLVIILLYIFWWAILKPLIKMKSSCLVLLIQYQHFLGWLFLFLGTKHNLWWLFSFKIGIGIVLCRNTVHVIDHGSIKKLTQNITTAKAFCLPVQMKILEKISNYSQLQWAINIKNSVGIV